MDYTKHYNLLVSDRKLRGIDKTKLSGYYELHHIVPRCLGGSDDTSNLVLLTAREHYIAHVLLSKSNPNNVGLKMAVVILVNHTKPANRNLKINSYLYEKRRLEAHAASSKEGALSFKDFTGQRFGRLTVVGLAGWKQRERDGCYESRWLCECDCGEYKEAAGKNLQQGNTKSCGCLAKESYPRVKSEDWKLSRERNKENDVGFKSGRSEWRCEKYDRPWKSPAIMKYTHNEDKWKNADYFYDCWKVFGGHGLSTHLFHKMYKETHNDNIVVKNYFSLLIAMFNKGWIPKEDVEWKCYVSD